MKKTRAKTLCATCGHRRYAHSTRLRQLHLRVRELDHALKTLQQHTARAHERFLRTILARDEALHQRHLAQAALKGFWAVTDARDRIQAQSQALADRPEEQRIMAWALERIEAAIQHVESHEEWSRPLRMTRAS